MKLFLKFCMAEVGAALLVLMGLAFNPWSQKSWQAPIGSATHHAPREMAALLGLCLALVVGLLVLGLKAWIMHLKSAKLMQRAMLAVVLSMLFRIVVLAAGLLWAVKKQEPGAFLLGFLCVYAMQLVLEVCYLVLEQKRQSLPKRENG
jgi:hypothetical protein